MSENFYLLLECLATYSLWALVIGTGTRLFRETRGGKRMTAWARVLGAVFFIGIIAAFIWTVLICESHVV